MLAECLLCGMIGLTLGILIAGIAHDLAMNKRREEEMARQYQKSLDALEAALKRLDECTSDGG